MFDSKVVDSDTESYTVNDQFGTTRFVRGEPVITTGADVSNYAVDVRDDGDEALTFRSFSIGTVVAGLGAALAEVSAQPFDELFGTQNDRLGRSTSINQLMPQSRPFSSYSSSSPLVRGGHTSCHQERLSRIIPNWRGWHLSLASSILVLSG